MSPDIVVAESTVVEVIEVTPGNVDINEGSLSIIEVGIAGSQGPKGDPGDQGPQGIQGVPGSGSFSYHHQQLSPAATWVIVHNLNGYPNITIVDSAGTQVEGEVKYDSGTQVTVSFSSAFAGDAYLS